MFVGRRRERTELLRLLEHHGAVHVHGPAGIGKSALVRQVVEVDGATRLPRPALLSLAGLSSPPELAARLAATLGGAAALDDGEALSRSLAARLDAGPTTLVCDDGHLAAPALIASLAAQLPADAARGRVVLVTREALPGAPLPSLCVPPLGPDECHELAARLAPRYLWDAVAACAGGNPLAVQVALTALGAALPAPTPAAERIAALAQTPHRRLLEILAAAEAPVGERELLFGCGRTVRRSIEALRACGLLTERDGRLRLTDEVAPLAQRILGEPAPESLVTLLSVARRGLAAAPGSADALLLCCRAALRRGEARLALTTLQAHDAARAAAPLEAILPLLRDIAAADPDAAVESQLLLARVQQRLGDFRAAARTLDEIVARVPAGRLQAEWRALRAEAMMRLGEAAAAGDEAGAPAGATAADEATAELAAAAMAMLRGRLAAARRRLRAAAAKTADAPRLEVQRLSTLAWSYLVEERHPRAMLLARRARLASRAGGGEPLGAVVVAAEAIALLGLGEVERAAALVERELGPAQAGSESARTSTLLRAAVAASLGELASCLRAAPPADAELHRGADALSVALAGRCFARAAVGLGRLDDAERFVRAAQAIAAEPAFAALVPIWRREAALLAEARGDRETAQRQIAAAAAALPGSPCVRVDAWALGVGEPPPPALLTAPALRAWAELRGAERALAQSDFAAAAGAAAKAAAWYRARGMSCEHARALVAQAEAAACLGRADEAAQPLASAETLAAERGYRLLQVRAALVAASLGDRGGDLAAYARHLARARSLAGDAGRGGTLARACARLGLGPWPREADGGQPEPWSETVRRLGLDRPRDLLCARPGRIELSAADELGDAELRAFPERGEIEAGGRTLPLFPQLIRLLELLVDAGPRGVTAEEIYLCLWSSREYHRLRHRNNVYVAVARLRNASEPLLDGAPLLERVDERYRLIPGRRVAVVRRVDDRALDPERLARLAEAPRPVPDAVRYARERGLPLSVARWECALLAATD